MPVNAEVSMIISARDQASSVLRMVEQRVKALEGTIMRARATMNSLSMGFGKLASVSGVATGALAGAVGMLTKMNVSIEDHLRTAQTMFDTTEEGWKEMERQIEETAAKTGRTLEDLSDALYLVGSAGIPAEKAMTVLKQTAVAATAGATDMQTALSSGISIINAYGLQIEDLGRVFALQFETVRKGLMTYEQLATDFGVVAPAAKQLGASLEEALAGYAALTKMGISSAESATATSRAFLDLVSKGEKLRKIGVEIYDEYGRFRGLLPVMEDLRRVLKGTQEEQAALLEQIGFEMRAARAIVNWADAYETLKETLEGLRGDTEALADAYEKQTKSIGFLWRMTTANLQLFGRSLWNALGPFVQQFLWKFIEGLSALRKFIEENAESVRILITGLLKFGAFIFAVSTGLSLLFKFASGILAIVQLLRPVNLLILAIIAGLIMLWKWMQKMGYAEKVKRFFASLFDWFIEKLKEIIAFISKFDNFKDFLKWLREFIKNWALKIGLFFYTLGYEIPLWIWEGVKRIGLIFYELGLILAEWIAKGVKEIGLKLQELDLKVTEWVAEGVREVAINLKKGAENIWDWLKDGIIDVVVDLKEGAENVWDWLKQGIIDIVVNAKKGVEDVWDWLKQGAIDIAVNLIKGAENIWDWLKTGAIDVAVNVKQGAEEVWDWLKQGTVEVVLKWAEGARELWEELKGAGQKTIEAVLKIVEPIFDIAGWVWDAVKGLTIEAILKVKDILSAVAGFFKKGADFVLDVVFNVKKIQKPAPEQMPAEEAAKLVPEVKLEVAPEALKEHAVEIGLLGATAEAISTVNTTTADLERLDRLLSLLKRGTGLSLLFGHKEDPKDMAKRLSILGGLLALLSGHIPVAQELLGAAAGMKQGGFTGIGPLDEVAGVVHRGEYIIPAWLVKAYPELVAELERIRRRGFRPGGSTIPVKATAKDEDVDIVALLKQLSKAMFDTEDLYEGLKKMFTNLNNTGMDMLKVGVTILKRLPELMKEYEGDPQKAITELLEELTGTTSKTAQEQTAELSKQTNILQKLRDAWDKVKGAFPELAFYENLGKFASAFGGLAGDLSKALGISDLGAWIADQFKAGFSKFQESDAAQALNTFNTGFGELMKNLVGGIKGAGKAIDDMTGGFFSLAGTAITNVGSMISDAFGAFGKKIMSILNGMAGPIVSALLPLIQSSQALQQVLSPISTIMSAMIEVLSPILDELLMPLVGILKVIGVTLGKVLVPVLKALQPIIMFVAKAFVWLYNNIFLPIANALIDVFTTVYNTIAKIWNWIADTVNKWLGWAGVHLGKMEEMDAAAMKLEKIDMEDLVYGLGEGAAEAVGELAVREKESEGRMYGGAPSAAAAGYSAPSAEAAGYAAPTKPQQTMIFQPILKFEKTWIGDKKVLTDAVLDAYNEIRRRAGFATGGVMP